MSPRWGYESGKMPDLRVRCVLWQILELMGHSKPVRLKTAPTGAKVYLFLVFTIIHIALRPDKSGFRTGARGLDISSFYRHLAPLERRIEQLTDGGTQPLRVQPPVCSPSIIHVAPLGLRGLEIPPGYKHVAPLGLKEPITHRGSRSTPS